MFMSNTEVYTVSKLVHIFKQIVKSAKQSFLGFYFKLLLKQILKLVLKFEHF